MSNTLHIKLPFWLWSARHTTSASSGRCAIEGRQSVSIFRQVSGRSRHVPRFLESLSDPGSLFHPEWHPVETESEKWPRNAIPSWEKVVGVPLESEPQNLNSKLKGMSRILKPRISCYSPLWKATKNGFPAARTFLHSLSNDSLDAPSTPTIIVSCPCNQVRFEGHLVSWSLRTKFGLTRLSSSPSLIREIFSFSQLILIYHKPRLHPWSWLVLSRIFRKLSLSSQARYMVIIVSVQVPARPYVPDLILIICDAHSRTLERGWLGRYYYCWHESHVCLSFENISTYD